MDKPEVRKIKSLDATYSLQLKLPLQQQPRGQHLEACGRDALRALLCGDLDFQGESGAYASHNLHAFPAKFPPQLPRKFIEGLTDVGEVVLDPMVGSGTTIVEAFLTARCGIGFDIDPMALRLCRAKVTSLPIEETLTVGQRVIQRALESVRQHQVELGHELDGRFREEERQFINYWFSSSTQLELTALIREIECVSEPDIREFLELTFSAIIITKSGGVSLARDLAHTRPHRVEEKEPRPALEEYRKRFTKNLRSLASLSVGMGRATVCAGNAQVLPLCDESVDLIVTSPPYAANAIDYMRAHKFSLVWFGHSLASLSRTRQKYIGHDATTGFESVELPGSARQVVLGLEQVDAKKAKVLQRYYSEMTRVLKEMARVLRPGKAAVLVVGDSTMRGIDTRTDVCLAEIGERVGLDPIGIAVRKLDRDKRMMPARQPQFGVDSQIERRMREEYVIGFIKPESQAKSVSLAGVETLNEMRRLLLDGQRQRDTSDLPFDLAIPYNEVMP